MRNCEYECVYTGISGKVNEKCRCAYPAEEDEYISLFTNMYAIYILFVCTRGGCRCVRVGACVRGKRN